jgi:hypothetical protein
LVGRPIVVEYAASGPRFPASFGVHVRLTRWLNAHALLAMRVEGVPFYPNERSARGHCYFAAESYGAPRAMRALEAKRPGQRVRVLLSFGDRRLRRTLSTTLRIEAWRSSSIEEAPGVASPDVFRRLGCPGAPAIDQNPEHG